MYRVCVCVCIVCMCTVCIYSVFVNVEVLIRGLLPAACEGPPVRNPGAPWTLETRALHAETKPSWLDKPAPAKRDGCFVGGAGSETT